MPHRWKLLYSIRKRSTEALIRQRGLTEALIRLRGLTEAVIILRGLKEALIRLRGSCKCELIYLSIAIMYRCASVRCKWNNVSFFFFVAFVLN